MVSRSSPPPRAGAGSGPAGGAVASLQQAILVKVLYITYDGLTDFLGQSQVLPYLTGSAAAGHDITVISFEKADRMEKLGAQVHADCREAGISWKPQRFRSSPPYLSKLLDQLTMAAAGGGFDAVHCRSYPPAVVGLRLKRRLGLKLIFDMRGFWPDSRREGGRWRDESPLGSFLFRRWKAHEANIVSGADHIVALTRAAKQAMEAWPSWRGAPISIIPCCADFTVFRRSADEDRAETRASIGIAPDAPLLVYVGSLGTIYLLGQQLRLFDAVRRRHPGARLLFVGNNRQEDILAEAGRIGIALAPDEFRLVAAERQQVGRWISAGDAALCFYTPTFSSLGVSPTKLGEYLACGVPVYVNRGVGDAAAIVDALSAGHALPDFSDGSIEAAADAFERLRALETEPLRLRAQALLDLPRAVDAYVRIYGRLNAPVEVVL